MADQEPSPVRAEPPTAGAVPAPTLYVPVAPPPRPLDGSEIWPPAARTFTAILLVICLGLLCWRGFGMTRWSTRPVPIRQENWLSPIDLNSAGRADLRTIPGIGEKLAERIVEHREQNGPFASLDDLRRVHGIGPQILARIRPFLRVQALRAVGAMTVRGARPDEKDGRPVVGGRKVTPAVRIDVSRATGEELQRLPGIGPTMAARIVKARRERPFRSVEDLRRVKGIGAKTLEKLRPFIEVGPVR